MSDQIQVDAFRALEDLESALGTFSSRFSEILQDAERDIERKIRLVDDAVRERKRTLSYWQQEYDSADPEEDDIGAIAGRLAEAEEDLQEALRWRKRIDQSYSSYSGQASRSRSLCTDSAKKAHSVLRQKIKDLYEYAAVTPDSSEPPSSYAAREPGVFDAALGVPESVAASGVGTIETSADAVTNFLLPRAFQWVSLDRINPADLNQLPTDKEFGKMSKEDMTRGMELLRTRILPEIQRNPNAIGSDYFWKLDQREGRTGTDSLRNIYDAYFGGERLRFAPDIENGYYKIDHGRHRVRLATESGWSAVPAIILPTRYSR